MKHNRSAFTLIEIVISLLVLGVGLLGILALFPVGLDASGRAARMTKATFLAQEDIEEAKRLGFANVDDIARAQAPSPYEEFEHQLTVLKPPDVGANPWATVTAQVFWPTSATTEQSITVATFIANYEP